MSAVINAEAQDQLRTILDTVHTPEFPDRSLASVIRRAMNYNRPKAQLALKPFGIRVTGSRALVDDPVALLARLAPPSHPDASTRYAAIRAALIVDGDSVEIPPACWEARQRGAAA